jgi:hypothetical protein
MRAIRKKQERKRHEFCGDEEKAKEKAAQENLAIVRTSH